jgi:glycosyltransferase involved in cell wall biosynthesis
MTGKKLLRVLVEAVESLRAEGYAFRAIFVGDGPEARDLEGFAGSIHVPFVPWADLPRLYRAADVAVWPCSISTSTLDASACGLPVVMSNVELATERWEGMGAAYIEGSVESMKDELRRLYDAGVRRALGQVGAGVMKRRFSWDVIAAQFRNEFTRE